MTMRKPRQVQNDEEMDFSPLPREEVIKAVERRKPSRIPLIRAKWWGEGLREHYGDSLHQFDRYPEDCAWLILEMVDVRRMGLSWDIKRGGPHDSACVIDEWAKLDEFIEKLPDPENDPQFDALIDVAEAARAKDRYVMFGWWRLFFERPWGLRGMENLMVDYYDCPDNVHRLHSALCRTYCRYLKRAIRDIRPDAFWASDDLGHQTQPMMSPEKFRELIKPYYVRIGEAVGEANLHWWLHSCGNNTPLLEDLIDAGVTVFHPVQKHTMDEAAVARACAGRLTFLAGIDVQHVLQEKDPDGVRREVRFLIDTFDSAEGGMCIAAGNGIVPPTPLENIHAFLDEALCYGLSHRRRFA